MSINIHSVQTIRNKNISTEITVQWLVV
uniref:Uncharacterized protein n=1 Tax=Anguilla anguilla TaxID=7936 RepID=A0A0E9QC90_ANGAN